MTKIENLDDFTSILGGMRVKRDEFDNLVMQPVHYSSDGTNSEYRSMYEGCNDDMPRPDDNNLRAMIDALADTVRNYAECVNKITKEKQEKNLNLWKKLAK